MVLIIAGIKTLAGIKPLCVEKNEDFDGCEVKSSECYRGGLPKNTPETGIVGTTLY
jgi:hypothetical protein